MAQKAHSSVAIFHSSVVIFETVQLWFSQFCDFWNCSVVIFRLDERDWNLTYGNWDRRVFFSRHFRRRQSCSCVWQCLALGCHNKANCPRGNKASGWICLNEFWSRDPWTKPTNGKPTLDYSTASGVSREGRKESPIKNIESKFAGFITTRSQKFLFQFVRRRVAETGSLLILRQNLPQLKNWSKKPLLCFSLTGKVLSLALLTTCC